MNLLGDAQRVIYGTQQAPTLLGSAMGTLGDVSRGISEGVYGAQQAPTPLGSAINQLSTGAANMFAPITQPLQGVSGGLQDLLYGPGPQVDPVANAPLFTPSANYIGLQPQGLIGSYVPNYGVR